MHPSIVLWTTASKFEFGIWQSSEFWKQQYVDERVKCLLVQPNAKHDISFLSNQSLTISLHELKTHSESVKGQRLFKSTQWHGCYS